MDSGGWEGSPRGLFTCELCELTTPFTYYGQKPPNTRAIILLEECYVMKDPFCPEKEKFLILGSNCSLCRKTVCVGYYIPRQQASPARICADVSRKQRGSEPESLAVRDCSLFYTKRFCLRCVREHLDQFPPQIQAELMKKKPTGKTPGLASS